MKTSTKIKNIEGRKVTQAPNRLWDVWGVGRNAGKVVFTGSLREIRHALKPKAGNP